VKLWGPKVTGTQLWQFRDSHFEVSGQNAIWMWVSWRGTKYIIRGKVVATPKFELWWVQVCLWLILAPKVFQLCTNHFVFGFVQARVSNWCLSFFLIPSRSSNTPLYPLPPKVLWAKKRAPTPCSFAVSFQTHIWVYQRAWECVKIA
jgi:hypothetical protein